MSFILDALKKSEAERNRKSGPVLMDMRIAPPRRQLPVWVWVIAIVLLANTALLGYALLRGGAQGRTVHAARGCSAARTGAGCVPPAHCRHRHCRQQPRRPAAPERSRRAGNRWRDHAKQCRGFSGQCSSAIQLRQRALRLRRLLPGTGNLPSDDDLRASGVTLPELHLSLHVYDDVAANRFVLLNSSRLREGQETAEGVMVEHIDPTGVVLSWRGRRFRMHPGN